MSAMDPTAVPLRGTHLIEASAGTGKTYAITTLYLRLLLESQRSVDRILVVTFTRAATAELRDRLRRRVREALAFLAAEDTPHDPTLRAILHRTGADAHADRRRLEAALRGFDDAAVFTIHGFCQRVLQEHAFDSGVPFDVRLITDQSELLNELAHDFWSRKLHDADAAWVRYLQHVRYLGERGLTPHALRRLVAKVASHPSAPLLSERSTADVQTLLRRWSEAWEGARAEWHRDRNGVLDALTCKDLKRNVYRPETVHEKWLPVLDACLSRRPGTVLSETLEPKLLEQWSKRLTPRGLRDGTKAGCTTPQHPFFEMFEAWLDRDAELSAAFAAKLRELELEMAEHARRELPARKRAAHVQAYDDLLLHVKKALSQRHGARLAGVLRARYPAALIDEFQDTDPVQYDIFKRVYGRSDAALFLIGDPKQAIYAFRGADIFAYLEAARDVRDNRHTLGTNWRTDPGLVRAVNALFEGAANPFMLERIAFEPVRAREEATDRRSGTWARHAPLQWLWHTPRGESRSKDRAGIEIADGVAADIARLLASDAGIDDRALQPGDVAVLCRTHRQLDRVQEALREHGIPAVRVGAQSVFDTPEAEAFERLLAALADPSDTRALVAALATPLLGQDAETLITLQEDEPAWDAWVQRFQRWHRRWVERGFVQALRQMLEERDVAARLLAIVDGERKLTNTLHLGELLQRAAAEQHLGPLALLRWLERMRREPSLRAPQVGDSAQLRLESDAHAVQLVTVHGSKGLEYPVVYCPFLWEHASLGDEEQRWVAFHDPADGERLKVDLGSSDLERHRELALRERVAEKLRLTYVALTRARHACHVVWGKLTDCERSALAYLLHQPGERPDEDDPITPVATRVAAMDADALRAELEAFARASGGQTAVADLPASPGPTYRPETRVDAPLACREARRLPDRLWRLTSFSGLLSASAELDADALDVDAAASASDVLETGSPDARPPTRLHEVPAGARSGLLIHHVLERLDFTQHARQLPDLVEASLRVFGFDPALAAPLVAGLQDALGAQLLQDGLRLETLAPRQRLDELEFMVPVASDASSRLGCDVLAQLLWDRAVSETTRSYADQLAALAFPPLAGFLRGYMDLVFEYAGRFYLVDYKSNMLGARPEDYAPARLSEAMLHHHYVLQYHLYLLALDRYLRGRIPGYAYDAHFGGVLYLFLRGMSPEHPPGHGVFFDRPPADLISGLSGLFEQPGDTP